jgi:diadenosine tetraphosphatase ApaH/serine/threonine PP2A family protein phosphatase
MRLAILSDIHGNLEALDAVLEDLQGLGVSETICLGDSIGYGPQPQEVLERLEQRAIPSLLGNHELAIIDSSSLGWFNPVARASLRKTMALLGPDALQRIGAMPQFAVRHGCHFVHGFPPDSVTIYLFQVSTARLETLFAAQPAPLTFVGHTHDLGLVRWDGSRVSRLPLERGETALQPGCKYLINVGSVGQPRDGTPEAKYLLWDREKGRIAVRCVAYDREAVCRKIIAAGLPVSHALRLR